VKILITGGGGFIGSHLSDHLLSLGHEVVALDISPDYKIRHLLGNPRFRYVKGSVLESDLVENLITHADLVYHLAAVVGVEHYVGDPLEVLNVNVNGTQIVLKLCQRHDKRVVFASTSEVYGKSRDIPFREDGDRLLGATRIDRWCYSTSKAVGEHFCFAYGTLGLRFSITRFFNVYGPRLDALDVGRVITIFMGQLLRGEDLTVIGDGKQTRAFTYVDDAMKAMGAAGLKDEALGGIFNIGNDRETTVSELAEAMIRAYPGTGSRIRHVHQEDVYGRYYEDVPRRTPDITRMRTILGIEPTTSLEDGLRKTIDWFAAELAAQAPKSPRPK
jgi:UDP-glucose 4-epimerase